MLDVYRSPEWGEFVRSIRAQPNDDALRLVAADWLEERGQTERAEFVRLQVSRYRLKQMIEGRIVVPAGAETHRNHGPTIKAGRPDPDCSRCRWERELHDAPEKIVRSENREMELYVRHWDDWMPEAMALKEAADSITRHINASGMMQRFGIPVFRGGFVTVLKKASATHFPEIADDLLISQPIAQVTFSGFASQRRDEIVSLCAKCTARWPFVAFNPPKRGGRPPRPTLPF